METTMTLAIDASADDDRLAFLAFPAQKASEQVTGTTNDLIDSVQTIVNTIISDVCSKRTASEFIAARKRYFPQYFQVMRGLGNLAAAVVPENVLDRLAYEAFSELEANFRDEGVAAFGTEIKDQAMFTVWTLRKINDLANDVRLRRAPIARFAEADRELAEDFVMHVVYSRFHLDCLRGSLRTQKAIYPEVLECVSNGLRGLVNAYAYIRQASDLRSEMVEEEPIIIEFDEEEQELVALSMKDLGLNA